MHDRVIRNGTVVDGTGGERFEGHVGLGSALGQAGQGVFEMVSDLQGQEPDLGWMKEFCRRTGRMLTFVLAQSPVQPTAWRDTLARIDELARGRARSCEDPDLRRDLGCERSVAQVFLRHAVCSLSF